MLSEPHWQSGQSASGEVVATTTRRNCSSASRRTNCKPGASGRNVGLVRRAIADSFSQDAHILSDSQCTRHSSRKPAHQLTPDSSKVWKTQHVVMWSLDVVSCYCQIVSSQQRREHMTRQTSKGTCTFC